MVHLGSYDDQNRPILTKAQRAAEEAKRLEDMVTLKPYPVTAEAQASASSPEALERIDYAGPP